MKKKEPKKSIPLFLKRIAESKGETFFQQKCDYFIGRGSAGRIKKAPRLDELDRDPQS